VAAGALFLAAGVAQAGAIGPSAYVQASDSPWYTGTSFSYFYLEDFKDGVLNVPGVTGDGTALTGFNINADSVDADDGAIDGLGRSGGSYYAYVLTFVFDAGVLGSLPTHAGLVWTDGLNNITFEAYGPTNSLLGTIAGSHADGNFAGGTAEDRFYGWTNAGGISRIRIYGGQTAFTEVDHLQYGREASVSAVPLPSSALMGLGLLGGLGVVSRLRKRKPATAA